MTCALDLPFRSRAMSSYQVVYRFPLHLLTNFIVTPHFAGGQSLETVFLLALDIFSDHFHFLSDIQKFIRKLFGVRPLSGALHQV